MIDLENEEITNKKWWKQTLLEIEKQKEMMHGKLNTTPWGHVDDLKKDPDFVRQLYMDGKVSMDFLRKLGIKL